MVLDLLQKPSLQEMSKVVCSYTAYDNTFLKMYLFGIRPVVPGILTVLLTLSLPEDWSVNVGLAWCLGRELRSSLVLKALPSTSFSPSTL